MPDDELRKIVQERRRESGATSQKDMGRVMFRGHAARKGPCRRQACQRCRPGGPDSLVRTQIELSNDVAAELAGR